jgi:hypothetical protein
MYAPTPALTSHQLTESALPVFSKLTLSTACRRRITAAAYQGR